MAAVAYELSWVLMDEAVRICGRALHFNRPAHGTLPHRHGSAVHPLRRLHRGAILTYVVTPALRVGVAHRCGSGQKRCHRKH
jgi:hypothetical protein